MLDLNRDATHDRRPFLAIMPWDRGFRGWDPIEAQTGEPWHPAGARVQALAPDEPEAAAQALIEAITERRISALLLVGRTRHSGPIRLQTRAENRTLDGRDRHDHTAAGVVRATVPAGDILRELNRAGLAAQIASDAEEDAGSYLLYRILAALPDSLSVPAVGLLRLPRDMAPEPTDQAIKVAASAIARHIPALTASA